MDSFYLPARSNQLTKKRSRDSKRLLLPLLHMKDGDRTKTTPRNRCPGPQGGGGTLNYYLYVCLEPASTVYKKKYQEYQAYPQNIFETLATP